MHTQHRRFSDTLIFVSPNMNDTGEMLCNSNNDTNGGVSIYIAVGKVYIYCEAIVQLFTTKLMQCSQSCQTKLLTSRKALHSC